MELLREDHLPLAAAAGEPPKKATVRKLPPPMRSKCRRPRAAVTGGQLLQRDATGVSRGAAVSGKARSEISEMIEHFRLGFANRTLGYRLPAKNRIAGAEMRGRLQKLGMLRESGHEHFNGSLVIPIFDCAGQSRRCTAARSRRTCAKARRCICTCRGRTGRLERSGADRIERNHPVRSADRRADLLVRGLPQRDRELWRERLHR